MSRLLPVIVALLALAAAAAVTAGSGRSDADAARSAEFQGLVHGFGLGAATDLFRCANAFDPRLAASCDHRFGPLPAGSMNCPGHVGWLRD